MLAPWARGDQLAWFSQGCRWKRLRLPCLERKRSRVCACLCFFPLNLESKEKVGGRLSLVVWKYVLTENATRSLNPDD
jgi:hypothetical protein